jgi:hypothetical protein
MNAPEDQLALLDCPVCGRQAEPRPVDRLGEARQWREANPEGWELLVRWALNDAAEQGHCSIALYAERLRHPAYRLNRAEGCAYLIDNTARAGLVRLLVKEKPQLAGAFKTRTSRAGEP